MAIFIRTGTGFYEAANKVLDSDIDLSEIALKAIQDSVPATSYADDAAAATAGVAVGEWYQTSGALKRRMT